MIFPSVRLSDLSRERVLRQAAFERSREALVEAVKERARPANLVRQHPRVLAGAAMSALSMLGLKRFSGRNGHGDGNGRHEASGVAGWILRFAALGGGVAFKSMRPFAMIAIKYGIESAIRALRKR